MTIEKSLAKVIESAKLSGVPENWEGIEVFFNKERDVIEFTQRGLLPRFTFMTAIGNASVQSSLAIAYQYFNN